MAASASSQSVGSGTTILELNDDCLRDVFDLLDGDVLAAVADVCKRFRVCAIKSASFKIKKLSLYTYSSIEDFSKLRNFGASIESMQVSGANQDEESRAKNQKRFIELVSQYCIGESIRLIVVDYRLTDELVVMMVPLLGRLQKLNFFNCIFGETSLKNLPVWAPEIRELTIVSRSCDDLKMGFDFLHQKFHKLESIQFSRVKNIKNNDIEEFFKRNQQLKHIFLEYCPKIDDSFLQWIAKYVPDIKEIQFESLNRTNPMNAKHFGQLRELKKLRLTMYSGDNPYILSVLSQIISANISLEGLFLSGVYMGNDSRQIIEKISKLQKLKFLQLELYKEMTGTHLIDMCKPLKELSELDLTANGLQMTRNDLLTFIRNAEKLREVSLWFRQEILIHIDAATFKALVAFLNQRREKAKLELSLDHRAFSANIPEELIKASSDVLTLRIIKRM